MPGVSNKSGDTMNQKQLEAHESRFGQIDSEIADLKGDVKTLASGQISLQRSQDQGFADIKSWMAELQSVIKHKDDAPPKISIGMLMTFLGFLGFVVVTGVGAFWAAVLLLFNPLQASVESHKEEEYHGRTGEQLALFSERTEQNQKLITSGLDQANATSEQRHQDQNQVIERLSESVQLLHEQRVIDAENRGRAFTTDEWAREDLKALKEHLLQHSKIEHQDTHNGRKRN